MPEFFVPGAVSLQEAEKVWQATKELAEQQTGWIVTNRRIFRLEYTHGGKDYVAEVGQTEPRTGEPGPRHPWVERLPRLHSQTRSGSWRTNHGWRTAADRRLQLDRHDWPGNRLARRTRNPHG